MTTDRLGLVSELIEVANVDTVYRDVYLRRARLLLAGVLSVEEFRQIEQDKADLATLPLVIGRALERADWQQVKELSSKSEDLRRSVETRRHQAEIAHRVYAVTDVRLDPFSPGLLPFTRLAATDLSSLRTHTVERLAALLGADTLWKDFYGQRRAALQSLVLSSSSSTTSDEALSAVGMGSADPREAAQHALKAGDMRSLAKLADTVMAAVATFKSVSGADDQPTQRAAGTRSDLLTSYSNDTLKGARRLGLAARRLEPKPELASLRQYAWNPLVPDGDGSVRVKLVQLPPGSPEALRERLEMIMIHPIVNSGGARHLPTLVAEDVLVEDFPDPKEGTDAPASELLAMLGLSRRHTLPRAAIEQALLTHGAAVLQKHLMLDPVLFRLVCIPPDVHLRLGEAEGWGQQALWTHFDGYLVMANGRLRALAGGDVHYGGLYHLLGISRDYDSDRVMARFAVVRRERMVAW